MRIIDWVHSAATGSRSRRQRLTPVGLLIFGGSLLLTVFGGLLLDRTLGLPRLFPGIPGRILGYGLFGLGSVLCAWCVWRFLKSRGTPVPVNPPDELIIEGAYRWMRNPMLTGVITALFGLGVILHSTAMALISTPLYILAHVIELKLVEEPELERRFGPSYLDYKRRVPMFLPSLRRGRRNRSD